MKGQDAERLAGVLVQCPALAHFDLQISVATIVTVTRGGKKTLHDT